MKKRTGEIVAAVVAVIAAVNRCDRVQSKTLRKDREQQ